LIKLLVVIDIIMPLMDGITALGHIMDECPTPVLMLSALGKKDAGIAMRSVEYGAVDFIPKPAGEISYDIETMRDELIARVKVAAQVNVQKLSFQKRVRSFRPEKQMRKRKKLIMIGASTGGPRALTRVLSDLPAGIDPAIMVIIHMHPEFIRSFVDRLQKDLSLDISIAKKDDIITSGKVFFAPGGCHLVVQKKGRSRIIGFHMKVAPFMPSIDYAMESAAQAYGGEMLGVLLTGVSSDGARGMKAIKEAGGRTTAEDESTCIVFGMPKAAIELGCVDEVVKLPQMAQAILLNI
jgi:two-component system chemotaxis response regulator CheB